MCLNDYLTSKELTLKAYEDDDCNAFYSLLMAAIRCADTDNLEKLEQAFPGVVSEFRQRYNAPGGALDDEELEYVKRLYS